MAVVPGFSVTELMQAVGHAKTVYDAFFDKYTNSASQLRDLADHIAQFQANLLEHKKAVESRGREYNGYAAIKRTFDECEDFINKYKAVLDEKFSVGRIIRTGRFQYEKETVARLQNNINNHGLNISHFNQIILLQESQDRFNQGSAIVEPIDINSLSTVVVTPCPPPLEPENCRILEDRQLSISPGGASPRSPNWVLPSESGSTLDSVKGSPGSGAIISQSYTDLDPPKQNPNPVLQSPLDYCVAKISIGEKQNITVEELRRKVQGRNTSKFCELLIFDENGQPRLSHQIKLRSRPSCYPYTWHSTWKRKLQVTFMVAESDHTVKFYGKPTRPGIPSYVFTKHEDYMEFQSQVRGKELIDYYDFEEITTSSRTEATDQHLKIWKNRITRDHSISFYANKATGGPVDLEFPIVMFKKDTVSEDEITVRLNFVNIEETKGRFSKKGRSSTAGSSMSTSASSIYSQPSKLRQTTGTTLTDSKMSVISTGSETSQKQTHGKKSGLPNPEDLAKNLKYIAIFFDDNYKAARFRRVYDKAFKEEAARRDEARKEEAAREEEATRKEEAMRTWQFGTNPGQWPESVISNMSPPGTPMFPISPELRGQASPVLRPQR